MPDEIDAKIINELQGNFPVSEQPFTDVAERIGIAEPDLIKRIESMLEDKVLSRFGPMYNADEMGGAFCLCAMSVPQDRFDRISEQVNSHMEVAHNYEREHSFNMWFVLATEFPDDIARVAKTIESETGYPVHRMPKLEEFFIGLKVSV
ncbi:MAG: Lrp/AsnC family transcriptional regulator [bacterium]|nr:Lrp/AsnC family transcriptional regulator [bacterium]